MSQCVCHRQSQSWRQTSCARVRRPQRCCGLHGTSPTARLHAWQEAMCKKCSSRDHACACQLIAGHAHRTGPAVCVATPCACPQVGTLSELCLWRRCISRLVPCREGKAMRRKLGRPMHVLLSTVGCEPAPKVTLCDSAPIDSRLCLQRLCTTRLLQ